MILTTHRLDEAERLCDRFGLLHQGRLVTDGHAGRAARRHRLRRAGRDVPETGRNTGPMLAECRQYFKQAVPRTDPTPEHPVDARPAAA